MRKVDAGVDWEKEGGLNREMGKENKDWENEKKRVSQDL